MTVHNFIRMDVPKDDIPKEQLHCDLGNFMEASFPQILPKSTWLGSGGTQNVNLDFTFPFSRSLYTPQASSDSSS